RGTCFFHLIGTPGWHTNENPPAMRGFEFKSWTTKPVARSRGSAPRIERVLKREEVEDRELAIAVEVGDGVARVGAADPDAARAAGPAAAATRAVAAVPAACGRERGRMDGHAGALLDDQADGGAATVATAPAAASRTAR